MVRFWGGLSVCEEEDSALMWVKGEEGFGGAEDGGLDGCWVFGCVGGGARCTGFCIFFVFSLQVSSLYPVCVSWLLSVISDCWIGVMMFSS